MEYTNIYTTDELPPILTVPQLAKFLGVGRHAAYQLARSDALEALEIGHQLRIPRHEVLKYLGLPLTAQ